jgi:nicotinamidase-related amidase
MNKRALLVIDIQNDYFPGGKWALVEMDRAAANAVKLIESSRAAGDQVIFVRHEFPTNEAPFFLPGSEGAKIHSSLTVKPNEVVILKHHVNAFKETELSKVLNDTGVKELVICGAMSHMCVDAATRAAADLGYAVTVIADACATRDLEFQGEHIPALMVQGAYMAALGFAYAKIVSTSEWLNESCAGAELPALR